MEKLPTALVRCNTSVDEKACGLLQMETSVPAEVLYSVYWYRSGTNQTMRGHLKSIADEAVSAVNRSEAKVLDIGCNDGTLLKCYPSGFTKFGIDPSDVAREVGNDINVVQDVFPSAQAAKSLDGLKFNIITSIAMFYDLEDPVEFARQVSRLLAPDGLWIFEMSYMPTMLEMNSYDTICHEHLEYYSLAVLERIVQKAGMEIVKATLNTINGGSIRCYATHADNSHPKRHEFAPSLSTLRQHEREMEIGTDKPYRAFQERINRHKESLYALLKGKKESGKKIHVYGASTKGNTILQWCGIDNRIVEAAADRNPDKYGARTLGTDIPIVSEEESRRMKPDYYLVLPWHFKEEFLERERDMLRRGVKMIFPLPTVEIIGRE